MPVMRVLIVDDEPQMVEVCSEVIGSLNLGEIKVIVDTDSTSNGAAEKIRSQHYSLIMLDLKMPGMNGMDLLRLVKKYNSEAVVVIITGYPTIESAVEAIKTGAYDYLAKPFTAEQIQMVVTKALQVKELQDENRFLKEQLGGIYEFDNMLGKSPSMQEIFSMIDKVAGIDSNVLIVGETGTGKGMIGKSIHKRSRRKNCNFVLIDCGALPGTLLESEIFGHEKGAFTGAIVSRRGLFEYANHGTLFLDEICELPLSLQSKLLGILEERRFRKVGGNELISVDVRIIAATNKEIEREVKEGRFREDLYFRLNVLRLQVPPLREHPEDIPILASHFLSRFNEVNGRKVKGISTKAMDMLMKYPWPGNVRELANIIERVASLTKQDEINIEDLPEEVISVTNEIKEQYGSETFIKTRDRKIGEFEKEYFQNLLIQTMGNVTRSAEMAGIPRNTLYRYLKKHRLNPNHFKR